MKTSLRLVSLFLLALFLQGCSEDENLNPEKVQFTFNLSPINPDGGRLKTTDLPEGVSVLISIVTSAGTPVLTNHSITLLNFGGSYITTPLELAPGGYKVVDFMLVNSTSEVLYATPRSGSPLASIVSHALPNNFYVRKNNVTNIAMDVVDVSENEPEDFGYVGFNVNVVNPLRISVFVPTSTGTKLTTASAFLLLDGDTVRTYSVKSKVNLFSFTEDVNEEVTLVVIKDGFARYSRNFNYNDLMAELNSASLQIMMEPAFTFVAHGDKFGGYFEIGINGSEGHTISVDWGDGEADSYTFPPSESGHIVQIHNYANVEGHFVSVTGDINFIKSFYSHYGGGTVTKINPEHLPELNSFNLGMFKKCPRLIDLSHNSKLAEILIYKVDELENVILPVKNKIEYISLAKLPSLTVASIDDIINKVFNATVIDNRLRGTFNFGIEVDTEEGPVNVLVGPPSPESIEKLIQLRDTYKWNIYPEL